MEMPTGEPVSSHYKTSYCGSMTMLRFSEGYCLRMEMEWLFLTYVVQSKLYFSMQYLAQMQYKWMMTASRSRVGCMLVLLQSQLPLSVQWSKQNKVKWRKGQMQGTNI